LPSLSEAQSRALGDLLARRLQGEPLSHLTGRQRFMGLEMLASPDALVPRKETQLLAAAAIALVRQLDEREAPARVLDVCTGSGNVALAIASQCARAMVAAADLSEQAVALARRNALHLGLEGRVEFRAGDLLQPFGGSQFGGSIDVLSCNPPYISSAKVKRLPAEIAAHEPAMAFDGGPLGIGILMRLVKEAPAVLRPGGWLVFEVGLGQGPSLVKMLSRMPAYQAVETSLDKDSDIRVIMARC